MLNKRNTWKVGEKPKGPLARIRAYLIQDSTRKPVVLNDKEQKLQALYTKCFTYMSNGFERRDVVRLLSANDGVSESNAHNVVNNTLKLYGDIYKASLSGQRAIERENFIRIANLAEKAAKEAPKEEKAKLMLVAVKSRHIAAKISGALDPEKETTKSVILPAIIISSDKSALPQNNVIDISHDEEEDDI